MGSNLMALKKNMGGIDRSLRVIIGALFIYLGVFDTTIISNQVVQYIITALGIVNIATAAIAYCPMYLLAHISTAPKTDK
jgi:hypothetical protein